MIKFLAMGEIECCLTTGKNSLITYISPEIHIIIFIVIILLVTVFFTLANKRTKCHS